MQKTVRVATPIVPARFSSRPSPSPTARRIVPRAAFPDAAFDPLSFEESEGIRQSDFLHKFDELLNNASYKFKVGQRVEGLVFNVDESGVYVDFGGKEMGYCNTSELGLTKVPHANDLIQPNTRRIFEIGAIGVNLKRMGGEVTLLNRVNIVKEIAFKRLRQMSEFQIKLEVTVEKKNAGGYVVQDDMGMSGFLPGRQALVNPATSSFENDELLGQRITVKILDLFEESSRFLVTQRGILDPGIDESKFALGNVLEGVVEGVMKYGVFVNAGGISGLLHASQISGAQVTDVNSVFSVDDRIKVMVLGYDRSRGRLSLSTKRLEPTSGDMLQNPQLVYERAEEMAEKFKKEVEKAAARVQIAEMEPIVSDVSVDTSRLTAPLEP